MSLVGHFRQTDTLQTLAACPHCTESGQITDISECPLCADFVAKGVDGFREQ
jgi:hypothetical protein